MINLKKKMSLPEYRERQEIYKTLGYKEVNVEKTSEYKVIVTFEVDETDPYYPQIRKLEKKLYRKGPSFLPVMVFVGISFLLLSLFVIFLARDGDKFDLLTNGLAYLLPAFLSLFLAVIYTYLYFTINKKIIEETPYLKENLKEIVQKIRKN